MAFGWCRQTIVHCLVESSAMPMFVSALGLVEGLPRFSTLCAAQALALRGLTRSNATPTKPAILQPLWQAVQRRLPISGIDTR